MHQHVAHPPSGSESSSGVLDNISDTLLNAFAKLRKPDERFLAMRDGVDKSEEGLHSSERLWNRLRSRTGGEFLSLMPSLHSCRVSEAEEMVILNRLVKISRPTTTTLPSLSKALGSWSLESPTHSIISRTRCLNFLLC